MSFFNVKKITFNDEDINTIYLNVSEFGVTAHIPDRHKEGKEPWQYIPTIKDFGKVLATKRKGDYKYVIYTENGILNIEHEFGCVERDEFEWALEISLNPILMEI